MAIQIQITSTNYNGQLADITFYPCYGAPAIYLGYQIIPYTYTNDNYQGQYSLYFSAYNKTCYLDILCPTQTPTPTNTSTPTLTPTPTNTVTPSITASPTVTPTNTMTPTNTSSPTVTPTNTMTPTPTVTSPAGTAQANTYLSAAVAAGGTVTPTMSAATVTLFQSLSSNGLLSKIGAMYPMLGATAASTAVNAITPGTLNVTWYGGMSYSTTGAIGNGSNAYGETGIDYSSPTYQSWFLNGAFGVYVNTTTPGTSQCVIGAGQGPGNDARALLQQWGLDWGGTPNPGGYGRITPPGSMIPGQYIATSSGTSINRLLVANTSVGTTIYNSGSAPNKSIYPGKLYLFRREEGYYANTTLSFAWVANTSLTTSQMTTLASIINTYQTSLSRSNY
jgi:hypothetical protein